MSKRWEKEDRVVWENSEVMQELESKVLENIAKIKAFAETKALAQAMGPLAQQTFNSLNGKPGEQGAFIKAYESAVLDGQLDGGSTQRDDDDYDFVIQDTLDLEQVPGVPQYAYAGGVEYNLTDETDSATLTNMGQVEAGIKVYYEAPDELALDELALPDSSGVVIAKLREVLKKASDAENYKLAYKIERIIDELNEEEL